MRAQIPHKKERDRDQKRIVPLRGALHQKPIDDRSVRKRTPIDILLAHGTKCGSPSPFCNNNTSAYTFFETAILNKKAVHKETFFRIKCRSPCTLLQRFRKLNLELFRVQLMEISVRHARIRNHGNGQGMEFPFRPRSFCSSLQLLP